VAVHAEWLGWVDGTASAGLATAILIISLMVAIIGGRIIPAFTRNVLIMRGPAQALPQSNPVIDALSLASLAVLVAMMAAGLAGPLMGCLAAFASAAHLIRLAGWQWQKTIGSPILWSLHLSYLFLVIGLAGLAASNLGGWPSATSALHLLAIGAIGSMTLAVMSRASLGHTGRLLKASRTTSIAYLLIPLAALTRSFGTDLLPGHYMLVLYVSGSLWIAGFGLFAIGYFAILTGPPVPKRTQPA
jgi:uncharacterized protein involved in response to NO